MAENNGSTECCPPFNPEPWEGKTHQWQDKLFIHDRVRQLFHMPLNIGKVIPRMWDKIERAGARPPTEEFIMLAHDPSPWRSDLYISVTGDVPGAEMAKFTGTFISRVFEGPFNDVPKWVKQMEDYVQSQGKKTLKQYFYYTTCPKCAQKYGKNYVVALAQVE